MELCSTLRANLDGSGIWGKMNTCICMAESLHGSPETITTLLIGYISSVTQLCLILYNPMDWSTPGFPVHHQLTELAQTPVHWIGDPSNHLILCRPLLLLPSMFPSIKVFSNESVLIGYIPQSEKAMAPHSSTLAWKIPWTEEPGRLQSMGSLRVGHD